MTAGRTRPIEDYALLGDTRSAALVARDGSVDWWCPERFDAPATFAALLGEPEHGRWLLAPEPDLVAGDGSCTRRHYRDHTLVLETVWSTDTGTCAVVDFLAIRDGTSPCLVRVVEGREGEVDMHTELIVRFDYGSVVPWVRSVPGGIVAVGGADAVTLRSEIPVHGEDLHTVGHFTVAEGESVSFTLAWHQSHTVATEVVDPLDALVRTQEWWQSWSARCTYRGPWEEDVKRSLVVLKGLTYRPTGGLVAAATTSLPEQPGGVRNWDYRYCWLRDASFTITALLDGGYPEEASDWARWLRRAVAGDPDDLQIMYGVAGERRLTELELGWLPGHGGAAPVRIGNAASEQFQLDVYGEVFDLFHVLAARGGRLAHPAVGIARVIMENLAEHWTDPDDGIWEVRGGRQHFTHSKVMAWVAADRWVKIIEALDLDEDVERWRALADEIHADVCAKGWNDDVGAFTQSYGSDVLDASILQLPLVGFLPPDDPRVVATVDAVADQLTVDGFVLRYRTEHTDDGLPDGEGVFLLTTFWLIEALALIGERDRAVELFERVLHHTNDVGLLAEELDPHTGAHLGNTPQAFSHLGLIISAMTLSGGAGPAHQRCGKAAHPHDAGLSGG